MNDMPNCWMSSCSTDTVVRAMSPVACEHRRSPGDPGANSLMTIPSFRSTGVWP